MYRLKLLQKRQNTHPFLRKSRYNFGLLPNIGENNSKNKKFRISSKKRFFTKNSASLDITNIKKEQEQAEKSNPSEFGADWLIHKSINFWNQVSEKMGIKPLESKVVKYRSKSENKIKRKRKNSEIETIIKPEKILSQYKYTSTDYYYDVEKSKIFRKKLSHQDLLQFIFNMKMKLILKNKKQ